MKGGGDDPEEDNEDILVETRNQLEVIQDSMVKNAGQQPSKTDRKKAFDTQHKCMVGAYAETNIKNLLISLRRSVG